MPQMGVGRVRKPKHQPGDKLNNWTVIEYLGHFERRGETGRKEHHYLCECDCGAQEDRPQNSFKGKHCRQCSPSTGKKEKPSTKYLSDSEARKVARACGW